MRTLKVTFNSLEEMWFTFLPFTLPSGVTTANQLFTEPHRWFGRDFLHRMTILRQPCSFFRLGDLPPCGYLVGQYSMKDLAHGPTQDQAQRAPWGNKPRFPMCPSYTLPTEPFHSLFFTLLECCCFLRFRNSYILMDKNDHLVR